jgi:unsaturated rhamnogalacturonyl hydrolase
MTALWRDAAKKENGYPSKWTYDHGLVLKGIERVWINTGDRKYFKFIQDSMDHFVDDDGSIRTYTIDEYNIDHVLPGRILLMLCRETKQEKYRKAAALLREQLKTHPRTSEGGFWHKKIYPWQMWLDGLYMGEPFYAEWAATFNEPAAFDDIAKQFIRWSATLATTRRGSSITAGMSRKSNVGPIRKPDGRQTSGDVRWVGMRWALLTRSTTSRKTIRSAVS